MIRLPAIALLLVAGWLLPPDVAAAKVRCSVSATDMDFGRPIDLLSDVETVARVEVSCRNQNKDPASTVQVCLALPNGFQPRLQHWFFGIDTLQYGIYGDAAHQTSLQPPAYMAKSVMLGADRSSATVAFHLHGLLPAQGSWLPGQYDQRVQATVSWSTLPGGCGTAAPEDSEDFAFDAFADLYGRCDVQANDLAFGSHSDLQSSAITRTTSIQVACTQSLPYAVHLGGGISGDVLGRRMTNGSDSIGYQLYLDTTGQVWGDGQTGAEMTGQGQGLGRPTSYVVRGTIPTQPTPPPGRYSDTVLVTVEY